MQTEEKQMKMSYLIKRFVPYFKKYKWILILDLICASLTTVCELVFPMLVRYITNMGINNIAGLTVGIILKIGLFYLILRIIDSAANCAPLPRRIFHRRTENNRFIYNSLRSKRTAYGYCVRITSAYILFCKIL
jgi:ABC-type multidrug transport system fused ATPase/permease subunit